MTKDIQQLVDAVVDGIQEKKGRSITVCDLSRIASAPARAFVLCTGGSPQQVEAITESVEDVCRKRLMEKPAGVAGLQNAEWVALDYGTVMVHIFLPEPRAYYDLESLWQDAAVRQIADLD